MTLIMLYDIKDITVIQETFDGKYAFRCVNCKKMNLIRPASFEEVCRCNNNHAICMKCIEKLMNTDNNFHDFMHKKYGEDLCNINCWMGNNIIPTSFCNACNKETHETQIDKEYIAFCELR